MLIDDLCVLHTCKDKALRDNNFQVVIDSVFSAVLRDFDDFEWIVYLEEDDPDILDYLENAWHQLGKLQCLFDLHLIDSATYDDCRLRTANAIHRFEAIIKSCLKG